MELKGDYRYIAFVSENLRDYYTRAGLEPKQSYILPRGVDFPLGTDLGRKRADPPLFFQACRLHPQKGPHVAIQAAHLLSLRRPDLIWRLEIAGAPEHPLYIEELRSTVAKGGLEHRVSLIGQISRAEVVTKMRTATAQIHASIFEDPFANTIVEALGTGTPLIGSDIGSIREVIEHEKSGLLFTPGNSGELAAQMERILTKPELARKLAAEGLRVIEERYTMDKFLSETEEILESIAGSKATAEGSRQRKPET